MFSPVIKIVAYNHTQDNHSDNIIDVYYDSNTFSIARVRIPLMLHQWDSNTRYWDSKRFWDEVPLRKGYEWNSRLSNANCMIQLSCKLTQLYFLNLREVSWIIRIWISLIIRWSLSLILKWRINFDLSDNQFVFTCDSQVPIIKKTS